MCAPGDEVGVGWYLSSTGCSGGSILVGEEVGMRPASWLVSKLGSSGDLVGEAAVACSDRHRGSRAVHVGVAAAAYSDRRRGSRVVRIGVAAARRSHMGEAVAAARRFGSGGLRGDWRREVRVRERLMGRVAG